MEIQSEEIREDIYAIKLILNHEGTVAGWAYVYIIKNDRHEEPYAFLENVYIEQEYRSQGLGSRLVEGLIEEAKKRRCYKIIGTSRHTSTKVHEFYKKFGFRDHGLEFRLDLIDSKPKQRD